MTTKFFYEGNEVKVKATFRNHQDYAKVLQSKTGCYFDKENLVLRVIYGRTYKPELEGIEKKEVLR